MTEPAKENPSPTAFPLQLQLWLSPAFPVGSFAYSHGLEWAVATDRIRDRASAEAWLANLIAHGAPRNDALLLAEAWRASTAGDGARLAASNALALAVAGSRERYLETSLQGQAFVATVTAAWSTPALIETMRALPPDIAYPIAVGAAAGAAALPLEATLPAFLMATTGNLVSALVRLSAIGQTDGQRILAALAPSIQARSQWAMTASLDDLGGAAFISDIAAMAHETLETRMFRT